MAPIPNPLADSPPIRYTPPKSPEFYTNVNINPEKLKCNDANDDGYSQDLESDDIHEHEDPGRTSPKNISNPDFSVGSRHASIEMAKYLDDVESSEQVHDICSFQDVDLNHDGDIENGNNSGSNDDNTNNLYARARKRYYLLPMILRYQLPILLCFSVFVLLVVAISLSANIAKENREIAQQQLAGEKEQDRSPEDMVINDAPPHYYEPAQTEPSMNGGFNLGLDTRHPTTSPVSFLSLGLDSDGEELLSSPISSSTDDGDEILSPPMSFTPEGDTNEYEDNYEYDDDGIYKNIDGFFEDYGDEATLSLTTSNPPSASSTLIPEDLNDGEDIPNPTKMPTPLDIPDFSDLSDSHSESFSEVGKPLEVSSESSLISSSYEPNPQWFSTSHPDYQTLLNYESITSNKNPNSSDNSINPNKAYQNAQAFCNTQDMELCTYDSYCPDGKSFDPFQGGPEGLLDLNTEEWEQWSAVAVLDGNGAGNNKAAWVQVGKITDEGGEDDYNGRCWTYEDWSNGSGVAPSVDMTHMRWVLCCDVRFR